jgi:hypothetical protein
VVLFPLRNTPEQNLIATKYAPLTIDFRPFDYALCTLYHLLLFNSSIVYYVFMIFFLIFFTTSNLIAYFRIFGINPTNKGTRRV